jgi:hypothetical protein
MNIMACLDLRTCMFYNQFFFSDGVAVSVRSFEELEQLQVEETAVVSPKALCICYASIRGGDVD